MKAEADRMDLSTVFSIARSMSTFQEARRSETRHCSSQSCNHGLRFSTNSIQGLISARCETVPEESKSSQMMPITLLGAQLPTSRLLNELRPDHIHILVKGQIVTSGGAELADVLERDGYAAFTGNDEEVAGESAPSSLDDLFKM